MRNILLAAGVAALAISAPVASKPGENKGQGGGKPAQAQQGGGGGQKADRGNGGGSQQQVRAERPQRQEMRQMRVERPQRQEIRQMRAERPQRQEMRQMRVERPQRQEMRQMRAERPQRQEVRQMRAERPQRQDFRVRGNERQDVRVRGNDRTIERMANRGSNKGIERSFARAPVQIVDNQVVVRDFDRFQARYADNRVLGLINGCPPGLAKKNNGCLPPGQAKKQLIGTPLAASLQSAFLPEPLRDYWYDTDDYYYRYNNDGYLYRVDRDTNLIASLLPLFGGGYSLGQSFPYQSSAYAMPSYYQPFYQDTDDMWYRYDAGYVYGIDPYSGMINNIIPTYDYGYGVGQMLPTSYSYYNLPYPYRSYYNDNDDYYYRYAPGAIYQVDRDTQLISAVASLLTGGFGVGQQLPLGYDAYNVPYAYRSQYYDTADNWYRYNNGYIYEVDPTSRLITAVIDAIV